MTPKDLYVPPCCISEQLPSIIRNSSSHAVWYSQGDWGLPKLTNAVESLVPSYDVRNDVRLPVTTILVMTDVQMSTLRYIQKELRMKWSEIIILVTGTDRTKMLLENLSSGELNRLWYCPNRIEAHHDFCNLWIRHSPDSSLIITGPIADSDRGVDRFCCYTSSYVPSPSPSSAPSSAPLAPSAVHGAILGASPSSDPSAILGTSPSGAAQGAVHGAVPPSPSPILLSAFAPWRSMLRLHATIVGDSPLFSIWR